MSILHTGVLRPAIPCVVSGRPHLLVVCVNKGQGHGVHEAAEGGVGVAAGVGREVHSLHKLLERDAPISRRVCR